MAAGWTMGRESSCGQAATHRKVPDEMYVLAKMLSSPSTPLHQKFWDPGHKLPMTTNWPAGPNDVLRNNKPHCWILLVLDHRTVSLCGRRVQPE